jgi:hypothetical protein
MHDIVGARIVCLFPDDLRKIDELIRKTFEVERFDDKGKGSPPEMWRYVSVHYDCRIRSIHAGPRYDHIKDRVFEIQVRTILQDAWATVEHYLAYKGENSIPDELRRDFSALVGLFHIADKSFQQIHNASRESEQRAAKEVRRRAAETDNNRVVTAKDIPINRATVKALLRQIYGDREAVQNVAYSELAEELADVNIADLGQLAEILKRGYTKALDHEKRLHPFDAKDRRFTDVGFARITADLQMPGFRNVRKRRRLAQKRPTKRADE